MVFETIVVDVLNRFLGDYVENLNRSQLKLGIWGGDVVLENLRLKQNALEELNIPVTTVYGHLGKLVLKIPWKNLYGESVEATIERLFLIVNPNAEVKYDSEKEDKMAFAAKQAELARVEEAKRKEETKDQNKLDETFVEKLVTQIIKNVQLKIKDIHIRYEDTVTNPKAPFSFGITLHDLSVHTTDQEWKKTVIQGAVTKIFKILYLDGLAVYWNPITQLYSKDDEADIKKKLEAEIGTATVKPEYYQYALGPINATAKLKLNPKPENDTPRFSIPKVILTLHMQDLSVSLNKAQYQDMMLLADSMDRMNKGAPYRKYRPNLKSYRGHYKEWWRFAYTCILEEEVRRRRRNWNWNHILEHRTLCKDYADAYKYKLSNKGKVTAYHKGIIYKAEKYLDVLNLVVLRQKMEMEVARSDKLEEEAKKARGLGWFRGWWGETPSKDGEPSEGEDIMKQFEKAMTSDEKLKLFRAIDYQENTSPLHLPAEYVSVKSIFSLTHMQVSIKDEEKEVLRACVNQVRMEMRQRPGANALRVEVRMKSFAVTGVQQEQFEPQIVTSIEASKDDHLLNVIFETNPMGSTSNQRVKVTALPLQMIYDAQTVIEIVNVFKPPIETPALTTLQNVAENKLLDLKEKSALGMQYAVQIHTFVDINIDVAASYIIIPQTGIFKDMESCVVVKLGAISVKSEPRLQSVNIHQLVKEGKAEEEIYKELIKQSYDKLTLRLTEMQIVISMADRNDDWRSAIKSNQPTPLHLLQPTNLLIQIHKCLIVDDPRLPKFKIKGQWDRLAITASEDRLLTLCEILLSMPLPQSEEATELKTNETRASSLSLLKYLDPAEKQRRESTKAKDKAKEAAGATQITEVEAFFIMKKLVLSMNRKGTDPEEDCNKFIVFCLNDLELTAIQKTYTFEAAVRLRAVEMQHYRPGFDVINVLGTPDVHLAKLQKRNAFGDQYLFTVVYRNVDKNWSEFFCSYECIEQLIELDITTLRVLLHAEGIKEILFVVNEYQTRLQAIQRTVDRVANAGALETIIEDDEFANCIIKSKEHRARLPPNVYESTQMKLKGKIEKIEIEFANNDRPISLVTLEAATTSILVKSSMYTQIDLNIAKILVEDLNPVTIYKEVLKVIGGDVINAQIVIYNLPENTPKCSDVDMSIHAQVNCLRLVLLNWYYMSMAEFMNNFQTAQQVIIEASSQAADVARQNVQTVYQNSLKIRLKIKLAAPIIIIPETSVTLNALLFDLGRMSIDNKFVELDVSENEADRKVTVDELTLELEDMKASVVVLSADQHKDLEYERQVLRPTSFSLYVKRSLSPWYELLPDLDVSGRFMSITITIGHSDYKTTMRILNENIQEGRRNVYGVKTRTMPTTKVPSKATVKSQTSRQNKSNLAEGSQTEPKKPRVSIKFSFIMDRFVIELLNTVGTGKFLKCMNDIEFARLCLALFAVRGKIYSDDSIQVSVLLVDCTLDDLRPGRGNKITRYLARRRESKTQDEKGNVVQAEPEDSLMETATKVRSMIDVSYTMNETDTYLDMRISSFNLILVSDFLNKIVEFLSPGVEDDVVMDKLKVKVVKSPFQKSESLTKKKIAEAEAALNEEMKKKKPHKLNVNVKMEQLNVIFVETLEHKKSDALVLNMEGRLKLRKSEERCVADGAIYGLQVGIQTIGDEGPESEDGAPRYLLAPTHLSVVMSQPVGSGMRIDVTLTNIKITMSPGVMALLKRVLATIFSGEEDNVQNDNMAIYYDELWEIHRLRIHNFWFLRPDRAREAIEVLGDESDKKSEASGSDQGSTEDIPAAVQGEICIISCPSIVVSYEMDIGESSIPILVMESSLTGLARDWSSQLRFETTWAMQISYYNIKRALWEPLVEPIEVLKDDGQYKFVPWELKMELKLKKQGQYPIINRKDEAKTLKAIAHRQANRTITLSSYDTLEITITNSGLEVLTQFIDSFSNASAASAVANLLEEKVTKKNFGAPYVLHNDTGLTLKLILKDNHDFTVVVTDEYNPKEFAEVEIKPNATVPLKLKHGELNMVKLNEALPPLKLTVRIEELDDQIQIPMERADKRYFPVGRRLRTGSGAGEGMGVTSSANVIFPLPYDANVEPRGIVSEAIMQDAAMHIYLCSILQITNMLSVELNVFYMNVSGNEVELVDVVPPNSVLRLPLKAVHTHTAEIFFSVEGFTVSDTPFMWRELQQDIEIKKLLQCDSKDQLTGEKFYLKVKGTLEQVYNEYTTRYTLSSSCFHLVVKPAVKLQNCLPYPIVVSQLGLTRQIVFQPGEMIHLSHLVPNWASIVVMIENYLDKCWVCTKSLPVFEVELSVWTFTSRDSPTVMTLELGMFNVDMDGTQVLSLYCPFWMLNKTGFTLCYRREDTSNVIFHEKENKEPILFSYQAKNFFGKKKAAIRIEFGEWSDRFSLDVPGSSGVVVCKHEKMTYQVAVTNQLTFNSLTKMVIFSPYFLILNEAPFEIQYQEYDRPADPWQKVEGNSSAPLWPLVAKEDKMLILRVSCSTDNTAPFLYTEQNTTCLKLTNEFGGIHVEVQLTEGGTYITLRQYRDGDAPALVINYTDLPVTIYEKPHRKGVKDKLNLHTIPSVKRLLFTWDYPAGPRALMVAAHKPKEVEIDLRKDAMGEVMLTETTSMTWVSFLDGLQRTVLFTDDPILAKGAYSVGEAEIVDTEYLLSMQGLGLSLVNDMEMIEIIYISISNSDIIWEECKIGSRRYKKADAQKIVKLEEGFQKFLKDKKMSGDPFGNNVKVDKRMEVNYDEMRILKPSPRLIRRVDLPGLWVSYGIAAHSRQIHAKLYRLQIDQQLPAPTFPVVLAPVALPRTVASDNEYGRKPFIEISVVERIMEHSKVRQYKYYKMLMQEFQVKLEMGLIDAVFAMFPQKVLTEQEALEAFQADHEKARQPLEALAAIGVASELKHFYDNLHLSPLKLHVSFSLGTSTRLPTVVGALLQSIGVTLTDMNDVIFKLSYYERNYEFLSQREFINQVKSHYTGQALKQLYVLVLGLDVIGNPYGLVLGLKKGVQDLFYEPIQGAIQGPGEFAEGLFLGVRSLVGHTVGGAAGAVSRITGAMGHGIAALSLDKDYQRRRRDNINKTPANLHEGLARSGKGLVMGVVDGVTGVFTQPYEGARDEGVEGFFKGLGKGAVGLLARPTSGVVDFAAGSLDAVRRWYQGIVEGVCGVVVQPVKGAQQEGAAGFAKGLGRGAIGLVVRPVGAVVDFTSALLNGVIRATDLSEDVTKLRPTRYLPPDSGVRPYSRLQAEGNKMLIELEKGKFCATDNYEAHVWVLPNKEVVLCTDKRLLYLEKNNIFGGWKIVWSYQWVEIPAPPKVIGKGVYIPCCKAKLFSLIPTTATGKIIFLFDEQQKRFLVNTCLRLMGRR